jgi:hypothetical protein
MPPDGRQVMHQVFWSSCSFLQRGADSIQSLDSGVLQRSWDRCSLCWGYRRMCSDSNQYDPSAYHSDRPGFKTNVSCGSPWIPRNFSQAIQTGERLPNRRYGKSSGTCRKESRSPCWSGVRADIRKFQHHNRKWNRSGN